MIVFLQLLLAHILGDFFLQPKKWVAEKEVLKWKSEKLYLHALLHLVLSLFLVFDSEWILPIIIISILHLVIDGIKLQFQTPKTKTTWFIADQIAHILVLVLVVFSKNELCGIIDFLKNTAVLTILIGLLLVTFPASLFLKLFLAKWTNSLKDDKQSLTNAGKYIGYIERILVLIFILSNHWEAVGFLITAKSVFRFGDLKEGQNRMFTEYILIGTMLSFGIAIIVALLVQFGISYL